MSSEAAFLQRTETNPLGRHMLIDYWGCNSDLLNNEVELVRLLNAAAESAGATVMSTRAHKFTDQGVTAVAILAESHISIHTWPEDNYAGVDVYTCGDCDPLLAHQTLSEVLAADRVDLVELTRGNDSLNSSITMRGPKPPLRSGLEVDNSWFLEGSVPGRRHGNVSHGFSVSSLVFKARTQFQDCLIFDNPVYGRVLILDGIVQLSTSDEYIYHEMIVHPAMFSHPDPKKIIIVGGGDGGTLREVLRHDPDEVVMVDIDKEFVNAASQYLPSLSNGAFNDPRVSLIFEDAGDFLKKYSKEFDVAIIDCNDTVGTSARLFEKPFYETVANTLNDSGICTVQAGSMLDQEHLMQTRMYMEESLGNTTGFRFAMPSYHCGDYVFLMSSKSNKPSGPGAKKLAQAQVERDINTKYWSPDMHHASQVLPPHSTLW